MTEAQKTYLATRKARRDQAAEHRHDSAKAMAYFHAMDASYFADQLHYAFDSDNAGRMTAASEAARLWERWWCRLGP